MDCTVFSPKKGTFSIYKASHKAGYKAGVPAVALREGWYRGPGSNRHGVNSTGV
jgi:hypothetical protein